MNSVRSYCEGWRSFSFDFPFVKDAINIINIVTTESYATLRHIVPASLTWAFRKYVTCEIETIEIEATFEKVSKIAYLTIHKTCHVEKDKELKSILLCHGDHRHPFSMLHLADMAQNKGHCVFSLHIPGVNNNDLIELHDKLVHQAISKIEEIVKEQKRNFTGVFGVGHSKGAILLAKRQFVARDLRIKATCSIAGRLNVSDETKICPVLKDIVKEVSEGILNNVQSPLMQIIPKDDWNASFEDMAIRQDRDCYTVPGMHLSGLFSRETRSHFNDFLEEKFSPQNT